VLTAGYYMLGLAAAGLLEVLAGSMELRHLSANDAQLHAKATFLAEAVRSADRLASSAGLALWAGAIGAAVMLLLRTVFLRAYVWARPLTWILVALFFFTQVLLMLQDGSIGIRPYIDMSHDTAQESLVNSLILWPGYFLFEFPAQAAGLVLPPLINDRSQLGGVRDPRAPGG
jgi:hypothetical protein